MEAAGDDGELSQFSQQHMSDSNEGDAYSALRPPTVGTLMHVPAAPPPRPQQQLKVPHYRSIHHARPQPCERELRRLVVYSPRRETPPLGSTQSQILVSRRLQTAASSASGAVNPFTAVVGANNTSRLEIGDVRRPQHAGGANQMASSTVGSSITTRRHSISSLTALGAALGYDYIGDNEETGDVVSASEAANVGAKNHLNELVPFDKLAASRLVLLGPIGDGERHPTVRSGPSPNLDEPATGLVGSSQSQRSSSPPHHLPPDHVISKFRSQRLMEEQRRRNAKKQSERLKHILSDASAMQSAVVRHDADRVKFEAEMRHALPPTSQVRRSRSTSIFDARLVELSGQVSARAFHRRHSSVTTSSTSRPAKFSANAPQTRIPPPNVPKPTTARTASAGSLHREPRSKSSLPTIQPLSAHDHTPSSIFPASTGRSYYHGIYHPIDSVGELQKYFCYEDLRRGVRQTRIR